MITLHRLGHAAEPFHLNPDLIVTVEANPDTVITLDHRRPRSSSPRRRSASPTLVRACRVELLSLALESRRARALQPARAPLPGGPPWS